MTESLLTSHPLIALHPFAGESHPLQIQFAVRRFKNTLEFDFVFLGRVAAELEKLVLAPVAERRETRRKHELWTSTCMEVFVGAADESAYLELNLSPAGDWNVYAFDSYRQGLREVPEARASWSRHERSANGDARTWRGRLQAVQTDGELARLMMASHLVLGATCVVEYKAGPREYWALAHAAAKPDFHRRESFRLAL